jgi:nucleoside 2-deoxyribosyltransferase
LKAVYLAGPLFSEAEQRFNVSLARRLERLVRVYLPQRDGGLMADMIRTGTPPKTAAHLVFKRDVDAILNCDYLIAVLDGRTVDEGVAFELGIAFAAKKRCIGLQTDIRRLAPWGNNPMITGALEVVFSSVDELVNWLVREVCGCSEQLNCASSEMDSLSNAAEPSPYHE